MKKVVRVLSIDAGGVKGIIPAVVLAEIEKRTGKSTSELFDIIAGTSTGGIIALGLACPNDSNKPRFSAEMMVEFYKTRLHKIFHRSIARRILFFLNLLRPKYSANGLEEEISKVVGNAKLSESLTNVLIPAYEIERREAVFFKSQKVKNNTQEDFFMKDVARATSAAPTYFPAAKISPIGDKKEYFFVDGSTFASDPAMCAYAEAKNIYPEMEKVILVSLGTGSYTQPILYNRAKKWGLLSWAVPILNIVFDGMPDTVEFQLKKILNVQATHQQYYFRLQIELDSKNDSLDNASESNLRNLQLLAEKLVSEKSTLIDEMCRILTDEDLK